MIIDEEEYLAHFGILRKSGRYPWGSGGDTATRSRDFLGMVADLKKQGLSDLEIAKGMGLYTDDGKPWTTTQFRNAKTIANNEKNQADIAQAQRLKDKGLSNVKIGEVMGRNESSVRDLLSPGKAEKADALKATANMLRQEIAEKKYIDVGVGTEYDMGVTSTKLKTAIATLEDEGYRIHYVKVRQLGTGKDTSIKVLAAPETTSSEVQRNKDKIALVGRRSIDSGHSFIGIKPPIDVNPDRVGIIYAEQGGAASDGVLFVRRGVPDLSLGSSTYAQVRVQVGGTHYIKGMAVYKDDLPKGVDILFNTNKSISVPKMEVLKPLKTKADGTVDTENPFGTFVDQIKNDKEQVISAMNKVNDQGQWERWNRALSSQFLSKQSPVLAKTQLNMTFEKKQLEFEGILALTNPLVKKTLLDKFADGADSSAVHLKAAALPRQATKVILPINSLKPGEIYAPTFNNGERVVLVRHPHGGLFEIPELVVNNRNQEGRSVLGTNAEDAIGIHSSVAQKLSGADFDGDTVLVIPNDRGKVQHAPALKELGNFDAKAAYPHYDGMRVMQKKEVQGEMGGISNLITDMTIKGATNEELARAVRHSMVVIDAEKHKLDYKRSAIDNGIPQLKKKYQGKSNAGASTLISKAKSEVRVLDRKARTVGLGGPIDPKTGAKQFELTGATTSRRVVNKVTGEVTFVDAPKKIITSKLAETADAHTLSSGHRIEQVYADHSNKLKALANSARLASANTKSSIYSPSAKAAYSKEVASLDVKLQTALRNAPLERQAQLLANAILSQKRAANPEMEASDIKKLKGHALTEARIRVGAEKERIDITDGEWTAIQAGAITNEKLGQILANSKLDRIKELATPRTVTLMTNDKKLRAQTMLLSGYTQAEVAAQLGVSVSTLQRSVSG